jgi:Cytochrome P460
MKASKALISLSGAAFLAALTIGVAISAQDKYTLQVPNGLAFSEFKGYEGWQVISLSHGSLLAVILGNPAAVAAFREGIPDNGKPFPDGARLAKIHWTPKTIPGEPGQPQVAGALHDVDLMVKDSKRFADSNGWGYAAFEYESASASFRPANQSDQPPQANDAKCGAACHTVARNRDFVFTEFPKR